MEATKHARMMNAPSRKGEKINKSAKNTVYDLVARNINSMFDLRKNSFWAGDRGGFHAEMWKVILIFAQNLIFSIFLTQAIKRL